MVTWFEKSENLIYVFIKLISTNVLKYNKKIFLDFHVKNVCKEWHVKPFIFMRKFKWLFNMFKIVNYSMDSDVKNVWTNIIFSKIYVCIGFNRSINARIILEPKKDVRFAIRVTFWKIKHALKFKIICKIALNLIKIINVQDVLAITISKIISVSLSNILSKNVESIKIKFNAQNALKDFILMMIMIVNKINKIVLFKIKINV